MNIKEMSINELKALAYDQLAIIEQTQNNLKLINQEILERQNAPKTENATKTEEDKENKSKKK